MYAIALIFPPASPLVMRVVLAQPRGFCAGVIRAIDIVEQALARFGAPVYVRHEIVHNRHVVESLRAKGARFVENLSEVPTGAITIFSAHGVARVVEDDARTRGLHVLDATCPLVAKVHGQGKRYVAQGRVVILIGHAGHPEVEGTMGQIPGPVLLVQNEQDVDRLELRPDTPVAYVTQTTLSVDDTRSVIAALKRRFSDIVGPDIHDICYATQNRQSAVRELAQVADVILVVGAKQQLQLQPAARDRRRIRRAELPDRRRQRARRRVGSRRRRRRHHRRRSAPETLVDGVIDALRALGADRRVDAPRHRGEGGVSPSGRIAAHAPARRGAPPDRSVSTVAIPLLQKAAHRRVHPAPATSAAPALSAGADARAAVPLQPRVRGLREDRLSRPRSSTGGCPSTSASRPSTSAARPSYRSPAASRCCTRKSPTIAAGIVARRKFVYLCTNALLMKKRLALFEPSPYFVWSVHLDGDRTMHDRSVCESGIYERAVAAIGEAKARGFRVNINCTLFNDAEPDRVAAFFDSVAALGVDGITVSPGYAYERAPDQAAFPHAHAHEAAVPRHPAARPRRTRMVVQPVEPVPRLSRRQRGVPLHAVGQPDAQRFRLAAAVLSAGRRLREDRFAS